MTDLITPTKGFTQPTIGSDSNNWGEIVNSDLALIDTALGGTLSLSVSGNTTLTTTQAASTGYCFTGTLSGPATIAWPSYFGMLAITNSTTGGYPIYCGISGGGNFVTVWPGGMVVCWSDGTDFNQISTTGGAVPIGAGAGGAAGYVAKGAPGNLLWVRCDLSTDIDGYLMVFDATSVPADGAVTPKLCQIVPGSSSWADYTANPVPFETGIVVVFSSTGPFTKTGSTASFLSWGVI